MKWEKVVIVLLTLAVTLTAFTVPAVAADYNFWLGGSNIAAMGTTYEVVLYGDMLISLNGGTIDLNFDEEVFEYISAEWETEVVCDIKNIWSSEDAPGVVKIGFFGNDSNYSGAIATLSFYIKESNDVMNETSIWLSKGDIFCNQGFNIIDDSAIDFGWGMDIRIVPQHETPSFDVAILGEALIGNTLTAETLNFIDNWGLEPTYTYRWSANGVHIENATDKKYYLKIADIGKSISVEVTATVDANINNTVTATASLNDVVTYPSGGVCGDNLTWTLNDSGTLTISGTGDIPEFLTPWQKRVTSIIIENGVTGIDNNVFNSFTNVTEVIIPDSVTCIGDMCFQSCFNLKNIRFSNNLASIGESAFGYCTSLENIIIPGSVASLGEEIFAACTALETVTISEGVTSIAKEMFIDCTNLKNISIPNSVTVIKEKAFAGCRGLTEITIPGNVKEIYEHAFLECSNLKTVILEEGLTTLYSPFYGCPIESIYLPASFTGNVHFAFSGCEVLKNINVSENNPLYSSVNGVLFNKGKTEIINYPYARSDLHYSIPNGVEHIGLYAFGDSALKSIYIPSSVLVISLDAFIDCNNLIDVYYGGSEGDWNNIRLISDSTVLTNANKYFNCKYASNTAKLIQDGNTTTVYIMPSSDNIDKSIILTMHKGNRVVDKELFTYSGTKLMFSTQKEFDKAVIMYVDSTSNLMPLCNAEIILADAEK